MWKSPTFGSGWLMARGEEDIYTIPKSSRDKKGELFIINSVHKYIHKLQIHFNYNISFIFKVKKNTLETCSISNDLCQ